MLTASHSSAACKHPTAAAEPSMQPRLAPFLPRALVPQPIAERLEYDQREPDLLRLPHPALSFDPRRVEEVMH